MIPSADHVSQLELTLGRWIPVRPDSELITLRFTRAESGYKPYRPPHEGSAFRCTNPKARPEGHPPKTLLIRGRAELDVVDGFPDEYLQINCSYAMVPEQRVEWEASARSLRRHRPDRRDPTWARLIDFETILASAVQELIRQREERQRA